jgi:glutathione S-transferase
VLELYQAEDCPHSKRVRGKLGELGVSYVTHNPRSMEGDERNRQTHQELQKLSGDDGIPVLVDHGRGETLDDADEIVDFLDERYG